MGNNRNPLPLYRLHELAFRTQYAELKDRADAAGDLLRGTPGTLYKRGGTGRDYWYRIFYPVPGKQAEEFVAPADDETAMTAMRERIAFAEWMAEQVTNLRKLGYQVADKRVASVLIELHQRKLFDAGLVVVGTLGFTCWLNEYGARVVAARTQDVDLARRQRLKVAASLSFLSSMQATHLPFHRVPGMPADAPSTSLKPPGREGLRVDVLAPGPELGATIGIPELEWHAQTVPYFDYLLEDPVPAHLLAGGHCIPIKLPRIERMVWHKLYASAQPSRSASKADKDLVQAVTLAAIMVEQDGAALRDSLAQAPAALRSAAKSRMPRIQTLLEGHPEVKDAFSALG